MSSTICEQGGADQYVDRQKSIVAEQFFTFLMLYAQMICRNFVKHDDSFCGLAEFFTRKLCIITFSRQPAARNRPVDVKIGSDKP